ncbi:helix-turn-helix transcriptional regulator [Testudinibacter sp. TR-2022]|uniref:helix-turn-helix domain-containing protein n=2 Tax=Testudinibacter sp. TR-2022 TaxID=2585029 RepID=UPI0011194526|nr:helix-turn-helix transcriptional regulator [Testudinibacter sp. TR-2022]TNH04255.1 helix-turn-helix transcriptional regulator [Testudinibacter sp. TR-2022]TNH13877.1 helix-turn-helix transcriptional regulator [Testudinibacter sp. TR-2022]
MNNDLITLALDLLSCTQKELAVKLAVSPTQISKWKKGEYMSFESREKLKKILEIDNLDPSFILLVGSIENARNWDRLIHFIAELAEEQAETGYNTIPLQDELEILSSDMFRILKEIGIEIPKSFPHQFLLDYNNIMSGDDDIYFNLIDDIEENSLTNIIYQTFLALNDIYGFYAAYIDQLMFNDDIEFFDELSQIESCLIDLAVCKIDISETIAPNFLEFKFKTTTQYRKWINAIKHKAFLANIPLKVELMNLVSDDHNTIGHQAERESLGFNNDMIHPDIYMNELLQGMRLIHQVLPAIVKKLDIKDFQINEQDLSV